MKIKIAFLFIFLFLIISASAEAKNADNKVLFYCDFYEGYDNNVNLDSSRRGDIFSEFDLELGRRTHITESLDTTIDYYLTSILYHEVTDATFYDNNLLVNFDVDMFSERANLSIGNIIGYNYYPDEEASTYFSYNPQVALRHNFSKAAYQKVTYDFIFRNYDERKAQDGTGAKKDSDRQDIRNSATYELAGLFFKDIFVKIKNQYFANDSNDQFMDYYDYWSYRVSATAIMPLLTKRLYGLIGMGYQMRDYKTRKLANDRTKDQKDDAYDFSSSLIFDVTKRMSISLNYAYRQNESNEPSEEYSGSIVSAGFHYAF